jgi:hypothetical protein
MITDYPIVFDGKNIIGKDVSNVVYLWTRNNIPCYIGITKKSIILRCTEHLKYSKKSQLFQNKLREYKNEFRCYILDTTNDYTKLMDMEKEYIKKYNTYYGDNPNEGYNLTRGGENREYTVITRKKIGEKSKGRFGYWNNKIFSEEHRKKISKARSGTKLTEEHKNKISNSLKITKLIKWLEKEAPWFCETQQSNNGVSIESGLT